MTHPSEGTDEWKILDSSSISIKGIHFRVVLTNYRVILINGSTQKQNEIPVSEVQRVKAESGLSGDPTILLFIVSQAGENKRMIFDFPPDREFERDQWFTEMNNLIGNFSVTSPVYADAAVPRSEPFFCTRCGNNIVDGSLFCNRCGTKVSPPAQPMITYHDERRIPTKEESPKISTEKISLPSQKTQNAGLNIPYVKPSESSFSPANDEPIWKKISFSVPNGSNQPPSVAKLCCGGFILLLIISAIFSSVTHGSKSSGSQSSAVSSTMATVDEPGEVLDNYLYTCQNIGATFPVKITGDMLYDYLSENVTATTSRQSVGIAASAVKSNWNIFDYKIGKTEKRGNYATVSVDITWQTSGGTQMTRSKKVPFVYEDKKWKLDEFIYSP